MSLKPIHSRNIIKFLIIDNTNGKLRQEVAKCDKEIDELKIKMQQMQEQHGKQIRNLQEYTIKSLKPKTGEISQLNPIFEKAHKWFSHVQKVV